MSFTHADREVDGGSLCRITLRLLQTLGFDREVDHGAAHLHGLVEAGQQRGALLDEDKRTKLALVVLKKELAALEFDFSVAPGHRDVVYPEVTFMSSTKLEDSLGRRRTDYMNNSGCIFFLT